MGRVMGRMVAVLGAAIIGSAPAAEAQGVYVGGAVAAEVVRTDPGSADHFH